MQKQKLVKISIVFIICIFIFYLVYAPHLKNPYPSHIDEWKHITEAIKIKNNEYSLFLNFELGFHVFLAFLAYIFNLVLIYKFLPAIWAIFSALVLFYVIYKKTGNNFRIAVFAMLFFASIKSNSNITGIWFFTPLSFSIPFIFLYVYFFTEGIEKQNKKYILASLVIMCALTITHSISILFAVPFLLIYSLFNRKYISKEYKFFSIFLIIPILGLLFYKFLTKISFASLIPDLLNNLQFKYGWGVLELNNSPLELYSLVGYAFAIIGGIIIAFSMFRRQMKYSEYLFWPLTVLILIIIFKITGISFISPYQRNLYYLAISLPLLSALGLQQTCLLIHKIFQDYSFKKIMVFALILLVFIFAFKYYFEIPKNILVYRTINDDDYNALKFISEYPKSRILSTPSISLAIYPVSQHQAISGIFFYVTSETVDSTKIFFSNESSCKEKESIIKKYNASYVLAKEKINCNWRQIYKENNDTIYDVISIAS